MKTNFGFVNPFSSIVVGILPMYIQVTSSRRMGNAEFLLPLTFYKQRKKLNFHSCTEHDCKFGEWFEYGWRFWKATQNLKTIYDT
jgi:hypothetical protein